MQRRTDRIPTCCAHASGGGGGGSLAWLDELPGLSVSCAGARFFCASFIIVATNIMNLRTEKGGEKGTGAVREVCGHVARGSGAAPRNGRRLGLTVAHAMGTLVARRGCRLARRRGVGQVRSVGWL